MDNFQIIPRGEICVLNWKVHKFSWVVYLQVEMKFQSFAIKLERAFSVKWTEGCNNKIEKFNSGVLYQIDRLCRRDYQER